MKCGWCPAVNAANARTCGHCGASLVGRALVAPRVSSPAPGTAPVVRRPGSSSPLQDGEPARDEPSGLRPRDVALLLAYVVLSSYLGLTGRFLFFAAPLDALGFMGAVWSASVAADLVFVVGTLGAGVLAHSLARRGHLLGSLLVGLVVTWLTYALSWALVLLSESGFAEGGEGLSDGVAATFAFVGASGIAGIVFATLAPALVGLRDRAVAAQRRPLSVPVET